ncbi:MAG: PilZ domain-containing protein [Steroidobacteraceae bacterium]|nr:PilZ domain-containing protein [Steroidobacteraceae bacterium]
MYDGSDTVILFEELAYQDILPVAWRALPDEIDPDLAASYLASNVRVLQAATALQEYGSLEKLDENAPYAADFMRIELKINLLLDVVGRLLAANQPRPPAVAIRFNALGATFQAPSPPPRPGAQGAVEIYLRECVVEPLRLIGRVANVSSTGELKVRFLPPGEAVSDLLEKLAFRRHRRQVAGSRNAPRPRRG